jgi:diguanylate cyclase (GGDEF)-like protein
MVFQQMNRISKKFTYILVSSVLFLIIFVLGSLAFFFSMREIQYNNSGQALSRTVETEKFSLEAAVKGEIALVMKMADSPQVRRFFQNPEDRNLEEFVFEEMAGFRRIFILKSIFWINDIDKKFYYKDSYSYTVDPDDPVNYWYNLTLRKTETFNFNINYNPNLDLTNFWINAPVFDPGGRPIGMLGTGVDVSEFVDFVYRGRSDGSYLLFFNKSGEITGAKDKHLVVNKTSLEKGFGKTGAIIFSMLESLKGEETQYFNVPGGLAALAAIPEFDWYVCAILPVEQMEALKTPMTVLFATMMAVIAAVFIIFNLIQMNFKLNRERNVYRDMSITDALTGIYNRRYLEENLERIVRFLARTGGKLSLLMLDIDYFKKYNDTYGHNMGDNCLKLVARTFAQSVGRTEDFVARYGGEEFVAVLPSVDERGAKTIAERLLQNVRDLKIPHEASDAAVVVTVSIGGITGIVDRSRTGVYYLKKADDALYSSKKNGRNRYTANDNTKEDFTGQLRSLGLCAGDVVLVHSSMKALGTKKTPQEFIHDIIDAIGTEGTLLVPALTYANVNAGQPYFSVSRTEPCIGLIPNCFFHMEGVIRSAHPTHSVCAYGKHAADIVSEHYIDETPVGPHSPFMKLPDYKGKILFIGNTLKSCTFMHGIEEAAGAPYTLAKERTHYIIEDGNGAIAERDMYAHDFAGWRQEYQKIRDILPDIKQGKVGQADCFLLDARALAENAIKKMREDPYYFVTKIR